MGVKGRAPQILADHLHMYYTPPPGFQTFRHHCIAYLKDLISCSELYIYSHMYDFFWRAFIMIEDPRLSENENVEIGNYVSQLGSGRSFTTLTKFCILFITYQPRVDIPKEIPDF